MARFVRVALLIAIALFVLIQFVPVDRTNPPVTGDILAPANVKNVLRRSCYDCHSHETVYPWYDRIAPASWLVQSDVREGREELNFSRWQHLPANEQFGLRRRIWKEVAEGEMPPWFYLPLHPAAKLTDTDKAILRAWSGDAARSERRENDD
jgi:hypothetical protein